LSRSPNSEQLLAINHSGGVLLKAGAGSGKTFVLVEHIYHLCGTWIESFKKKSFGSFEDHIRLHFSQVVMMTFTKKAAGEMSIRLAEKFQQLALEKSEDQSYWIIINDHLPLLLVTTIDGFCRKLITSGYFPHLSNEAKIIFNAERKDQVGELIELWFEYKSTQFDQELLNIVIREKESLLKAYTAIFSDPGLRLSWRKFDPQMSHPDRLGDVLKQSFKLNDFDHSLTSISTLDLPEESERSAFEKGMGELLSIGLSEVHSVELLEKYYHYLSSKTFQPERTAAKKCAQYTRAHEARADFKKWAVDWFNSVKPYQEHYEGKILPWIKICLDIFNWIDDGIDPNQGLTFGDIEYHVALGLENNSDRERIQKTFHYFIVDEFQDTSALQFKIIRSLINNDFNRLFCVGDAKQAIYGFRGGELSVFQDCAELVPNVRTLANNYRSFPEIIRFNNSLFRTVLPLGQDFIGLDPFSVLPEDQAIPVELDFKQVQGEIELLKLKLDRDIKEEGKFKNEHINRLEAFAIAQSIKKERELHPHQVCTILYSKLKPSMDLIRYLMQQNIGFTAQFKIDLLDDPLMGIFLTLLKRKFDSKVEAKDRFPLFVIENYLKILDLPSSIDRLKIEKFEQDVSFWGLVPAFRKFLHSLGVTNENFDINFEEIETMATIYHQDPESIMSQLAKGDNERMSLELRWGKSSAMVQLMSAHASKGLEFDTVYLGGIYTNGKENSDGSLFGQLPASFKWYMDLSQRDKRDSPFYLFENELSQYKNFSESKRLFYVACTRAKKKLTWVELELPDGSFSIPGNSWIEGLRAWFNHQNMLECKDSLIISDLDSSLAQRELSSKSQPQLPLFFHDSVGIVSKGVGESELFISGELSVTKLNSLIDCPRKFYLENTLKLKPTSDLEMSFDYQADEAEELATMVRSSSGRGTHIHEQIAYGIEHNFVVPLESFQQEFHQPIKWALDQAKQCQADFELISEKSLKFKFFNFMISGIPDLILLPKLQHNAQVWDFKTGRITQENLAHYWIQLKVYAYALYSLKRVPLSSEIELKLVFVDQEKVLEQKVTFNQVESDLYPLWQSQNEPWKIKTDHCSQCPYGDICPR
jgi:ATP-dependent helicase/nuclease subunit A